MNFVSSNFFKLFYSFALKKEKYLTMIFFKFSDILPILTGFCFIYLFLLFSAILFAGTFLKEISLFVKRIKFIKMKTLKIFFCDAVELKCRQLLHVTYKLFMISIALQNAGIVNLCIAYGNYASNGIGLPNIKLLGKSYMNFD